MPRCSRAATTFVQNSGSRACACGVSSICMERHCRNAEAVAAYLEKHPAVEFVNYPRLPGHPQKALADKYLPKGCSGVISLSLKGGREAGANFIDNLKMISLQVHVADIRTCVLHPASSTHRQLTDEQLREAGITPGMVAII